MKVERWTVSGLLGLWACSGIKYIQSGIPKGDPMVTERPVTVLHVVDRLSPVSDTHLGRLVVALNASKFKTPVGGELSFE